MPTLAPGHPSSDSVSFSTTFFELFLHGPDGKILREIQDHSRKILEAQAETTSERSRIADLKRYLGQMSSYDEEDPLISKSTAALSLKAWGELWDVSGRRLPVPDACPGPEGQLLYTWDRKEHHLELEIFPDGRGEFFYRNRKSGELWDLEYMVKNFIPAAIFGKLRLFM